MQKMKDFFSNSEVLFVSAVLGLSSWIIWGLAEYIIEGNYDTPFDAIFYLCLLVGLVLAYRKGETNIQKALLGALFMMMCKSSIQSFWFWSKTGTALMKVLGAITFILSVLGFVGHLLQQSDHAGKQGALLLNQCMGILAVILVIIGFKQAMFTDSFPTCDVTFILAWFFTVIVIICIETRINTYKQIRAEAKESGVWNEDTRKEAKEIFKI